MAGKGSSGGKADISALRALVLVGQLGLVMSAGVLLGVAGGIALDNWAGGGGIWIAVGALAGVAGGGYAVFQLLKKVL